MLTALTFFLTLTTPTAPAGPAAPPRAAVLEAIDLQYSRGEIDARTRHVYRVAALRRPDRLPRTLRGLARQRALGRGQAPVLWRSGTDITRAAWRWVSENQAWHGELHRLLQPPPDNPYWLDSSVLPLRVSYIEEHHDAVAAAVLEFAEHSWLTEVDDYGFLPPPIEPGTERYRMYVEDAGPTAAGYMAPYEQNLETSWRDCFSYIVIGPSSNDLAGVVAHEMSHATQGAMDCEEISTFWENTSTYIMSQVYPTSWDYTLYTMAYFQANPWRPLDFMRPSAAPFYEYGGALLLLYLTDTYAAPGEGGAMTAEIWTAAMQDQTTEINEPDYFDAIAEVVGTRGGASDFDDIFMDFSEARFFVGHRDDDQHITDAYTYYGAEVAIAARHWTSSLPVETGYVDESMWPEEYGVAYVTLDLGGRFPYGLRIRFNGSDQTRWRVRLVRHGDGLDTVHEEMTLDASTFEGTHELSITDHPKLLLMAASLGPEGWDPDSSSARSYLFLYDIEPILPPVTVTSVSPSPVEQGRMAILMELEGDGFVDGADFDVDFDDPGLHVAAVNTVDVTHVTLVLSVSPSVPVGPHDVIVTNGDGIESVSVGLLNVVAKAEPPAPEPPSDGCGCRTSSPLGSSLPLLGLLVLLLVWRRRSRRRT